MRSASATSFALLAVLLAALLATPSARAEDLNRIVLRVNEQIATLREFEERRDERLQMIGTTSGLPEAERRKLAAEVGKAAMKDLFDELLILSRAQQLRVVVTREQVDRAVESARTRFGIPTQEEFVAALSQSGLTLDAYRSRLEKQLQTQEVLGREVQSRVKADEEVLLRYYREHPSEFQVPERLQVRELVIPEAARPNSEECAALAAEVRGRLAGGEPMGDLATERSAKGETTAMVDLGWIGKGELAPALEAVVWNLAPGAVSEPVAGRGGLHLLQLVAREPEHRKPFSEVRAEIEARETERIYERESRRYFAEIAAKAYVFESLPAEAVGYRTLEPPVERNLLDLPAPAPAPEGAPAVSPASGTPPTAPPPSAG